MIIDAHAHAAGLYSTGESLINMSKKYQIEKILLCTSPKNNIDLKAPPKFPFEIPIDNPRQPMENQF